VIRYHISIIILLILAGIAQHLVPAISSLYDSRLLILPLFFLCASVTSGAPMMLLMAFIGGFIWDCQHNLAAHGGNLEIYPHQVEKLRFGYSIILYGIMGAIIIGFRPFFLSGKWQIATVATSFSVYFYLWLEYLLINIIRGDFSISVGVFYHNTLTAIFTAALAPLIFYTLGKLATMFNHVIRDDHRKKRYFSSQETEATS